MRKHGRVLAFCLILMLAPALCALGVELDSFWVAYALPGVLILASAVWASLGRTDEGPERAAASASLSGALPPAPRVHQPRAVPGLAMSVRPGEGPGTGTSLAVPGE